MNWFGTCCTCVALWRKTTNQVWVLYTTFEWRLEFEFPFFSNKKINVIMGKKAMQWRIVRQEVFEFDVQTHCQAERQMSIRVKTQRRAIVAFQN